MERGQRVDLDPGFEVTIPGDWVAERDEEGGVLIAKEDGVGLLHLVSFPQLPDEMPDPAEELYSFLEDSGVELLEDEIDDVELPDGAEMSLCEYVAEEEDESSDEATFWTVAVAVRPGMLVLASYSCPLGEEDRERETLREVLATLRLRPPE